MNEGGVTLGIFVAFLEENTLNKIDPVLILRMSYSVFFLGNGGNTLGMIPPSAHLFRVQTQNS